LSALLALASCDGSVFPSAAPLASGPEVDVAYPVVGVPDKGRDPAVVSVQVAGQVICAGALVAPDVVVTAAQCAANAMSAADGASTPLTVQVGGGSLTGPSSSVRAITVPTELDAAVIALLLLDTPVDTVAPLVVRSTGIAVGDHVRTLVYAAEGLAGVGADPTPTVRDHIAVVAETETEFELAEAPCTLGCGGPVIDGATATLVGILSRPLAPDDASPSPYGDVAIRADAFVSFVTSALQASASPPRGGSLLHTTKGDVDFGAACEGAVDCAAGICVSNGPQRYCSRSCASSDRCATRSRCATSTVVHGSTSASLAVCVET
jgi:hypothetical protein